jgi:hypothetical protein
MVIAMAGRLPASGYGLVVHGACVPERWMTSGHDSFSLARNRLSDTKPA